jgi:hypothetical protein
VAPCPRGATMVGTAREERAFAHPTLLRFEGSPGGRGSPPRKADLDPAASDPRSGINEVGRTLSAWSTDRISIEVRPHIGKIERTVIMIVVAMRSALDRSRAGRSEDTQTKKRCWQLGFFAYGMRHGTLQGLVHS